MTKIILVEHQGELPRGSTACRLCLFDRNPTECSKPEYDGCVQGPKFYYTNAEPQLPISQLRAYADLTCSDWGRTLDGRVLQGVAAIAPCTRREVAQHMDIQASTVSGAVNRLLKQGTLLTEVSNPGDRPCKVTGRLTNILNLHPSVVRP